MHQSFPNEFPNSIQEPFLRTSPQDMRYNCIGWAFGDNKKFYWPSDFPEHFWPENVKKEESVDAFIELYESVEYSNCEDGELEAGYEKIAIFALNGEPKHAARQLEDGFWTSKLGSHVDVTHSIHAIEGGTYGDVVQYMKRRIVGASLHRDAPVMEEKDFKAIHE